MTHIVINNFYAFVIPIAICLFACVAIPVWQLVFTLIRIANALEKIKIVMQDRNRHA